MQSKEKRKTNPRRRLLIRLSLAIVAIAIVLGLRALKPKGAQIVYIAPDENGYDAIWLADLNDPENPRQLTAHEGMFIRDFQVSEENSMAFYHTFSNDPENQEFWTINVDTGQQHQLKICEAGGCNDFQLHPNGKWLIFQQSNQIYINYLENFSVDLVFDSYDDYPDYHLHPRWAGNTNSLVFRVSGNDEIDEFGFYNIVEQRIVHFLTFNTDVGILQFSNDGSLYVYDSMLGTTLGDIHNPELRLDVPYYFSIWDPNNEDVLVVDIFPSDENNLSWHSVFYLFNIIIGETESLLWITDLASELTFNSEGSQILYSVYIPEVYNQFMLFDMETREEITLPIVGRDPQWVNGGR